MATIKVEFNGDLRRVALQSTSLEYPRFIELIQNLFDITQDTELVLKYTDNESDQITIANQDDLNEALISHSGSMLKLQIQAKNNSQPRESFLDLFPTILQSLSGIHLNSQRNEQEPPQCKKTAGKFVHRAICDNCQQPIVGIRFKCTQCENYDLCEQCEPLPVHPEHSFIKIAKPFPFPHCRGGNFSGRRGCAPSPACSGQRWRNQKQFRCPNKDAGNEEQKSDVPTNAFNVKEDKAEHVKEDKAEHVTLEDEYVPSENDLRQLEEMGFTSYERNVEALIRFRGNVARVVRFLLN